MICRWKTETVTFDASLLADENIPLQNLLESRSLESWNAVSVQLNTVDVIIPADGDSKFIRRIYLIVYKRRNSQ